MSLEKRIERQRRLVETLERRLFFERLVLERLEARGGETQKAGDAPAFASIEAVYRAARERAGR